MKALMSLLLMLLLMVGTPLVGLQNAGPVVQGYIGVYTRGNTRTRSNGIEISGVEPGGPADQAGVRPGDVIISIGDSFVVTIDELRALVHSLHPGDQVDVSYRRGALISETYIVVAPELASAPTGGPTSKPKQPPSAPQQARSGPSSRPRAQMNTSKMVARSQVGNTEQVPSATSASTGGHAPNTSKTAAVPPLTNASDNAHLVKPSNSPAVNRRPATEEKALSIDPTSGASGKLTTGPQPNSYVTNGDVLRMIEAGLSENTIAAAIKSRPQQFDLSPNSLVELKRGGVPESIIDAMIASAEPQNNGQFNSGSIFPNFVAGAPKTPYLPGKPERALGELDVRRTGQQSNQDYLSDKEVQEAITRGMFDKNRSGNDIGLVLEDSGQKFSNAMSAFNTNRSYDHSEHSGFGARMFTPSAWVAWRAHEAKRKFQSYKIDDVTLQDRLRVLRVIVSPDTPEYVVAGRGMRASSSVEHVVLRSENKNDAFQPITIEPYLVEAKNAMGGNMAYNGVVAAFSMHDLEQARSESPKREFLITVVGENGKQRDFTVKTKHFSRLD